MQRLNLRKIGCSDYATVIDRDRYREPVTLWSRLVHGFAPVESDRLKEAASWGHALEETIARVACERGVVPGGRAGLYRPPSMEPAGRPWQRYSPDFIAGVLDVGGTLRQLAPPALIDCKVRNSRSLDAEGWGEPGSAEIGVRELCQMQGLLESVRADRDAWVGTDIPDMPEAHVLVLVDGQALRPYRVPYDPELAGLLTQEAERFWHDFVVTREPPPLRYTEYTAAELRRRFPEIDEELTIPAPVEAQAIAAELARTKASLVELEQREQALTLRLEEIAAGAKRIRSTAPEWQWTQWEAAPPLAWGRVLQDLAARAGLEGRALEAYLDGYRGAPRRASRLTWKG